MKLRVTASTVSVRRKLEAVVRKTESPDKDYQRWLRRAAEILRSFWYKRFERFSRGGGNWKSTKRRKGTRGLSRRALILRDTHTLIKALSAKFRNLPGQWERIKGNQIETGYGGSKRHPRARMTVRRLAQIHNEGLGRMPRRQIVVRPDRETRERIASSGKRMMIDA